MYCKNCGNMLNDNDKFCTKCGTKNEKNKVINNNIKRDFFKSFNVLFIISIILFFIIVIIDLLFIKLYINEPNGMAGLWLFFCMIITGIPFLALIVLSIINIISIIRYRKNGSNIPTKIKILGIINTILAPIIILIYSLGSGFKESQNNNIMNEKLNELYGSSYEILDTCSYSNTGGDYYMEYLLKISNFEYPIVAHIDLNDNSYSDNYDELLRTKQLNYQSYIDDVFNDKTIALMDLYESDSYKSVELNIIVTSEYLNSKNLLEYNIQQIINKYTAQFPNYDLDFAIYFTKKIDDTKTIDYYTLLNSGTGSCYEQFSKNINKSELKVISVFIRDDTDINEEIKTSMENIIDFSTRY